MSAKIIPFFRASRPDTPEPQAGEPTEFALQLAKALTPGPEELEEMAARKAALARGEPVCPRCGCIVNEQGR